MLFQDLVESLAEDDLLIVLISGGGSALLPLPRPPVSLQEKLALVKGLAGRGADILELNCVRKRLSLLKGGGLAALAHPATVVALVLSDVIGDPLDFIASGPTMPNLDDPGEAMRIIEKYELCGELPESIKGVLGVDAQNRRGCQKGFPHVHNFIIGMYVIYKCNSTCKLCVR